MNNNNPEVSLDRNDFIKGTTVTIHSRVAAMVDKPSISADDRKRAAEDIKREISNRKAL